MTHISIRAEFDAGRNIEFIPTHSHPLGVSDIRAIAEDEHSALEMEFESDNPVIDEQRKDGRARVKAKITFHEPATIFALVQGGWLPMPFAIPPRFLVDRNVVISLRKLREGKVLANGPAIQWWTKFFEQGSGTFSPLPYAFEAGYRRKPTMAEFVSAYDDGVSELLDALPNCHVVRFATINYRVAYAQLEAFDDRNEREVRFLQAVCPIVADRLPRRKEVEVAQLIVCTADDYQVKRASLVVLAVLSCLYEDLHGMPPAIGRQVLKPRAEYSEADAFNALSDLRHLELAAAGQAYFNDEAFALCTCDRALALLWCALSLRGESPSGREIEFTLDLTVDLFPRLSTPQLLDLKQLLRA